MRKFLSLFLVIALAACGDATGISSTPAGTYQLYAIDGQRVPATFDTEYGYDVFRDGELRLDRNGSFTETVLVDEVSSTGTDRVIDEERGTYEVFAGGEMTFYYDDGAIDAEYDNNTIVMYIDLGFGDYFTVEYRR